MSGARTATSHSFASRVSESRTLLHARSVQSDRESGTRRRNPAFFRAEQTMDQLTSDIRSGLRLLIRYPTLSLVAVLTLGLGIGLGTTVFCVVNGALFKGLPFPDADRIVALVATN